MPVLKEHLKEIVDLVELVPEQFKILCFELLLKEAIESSRVPHGRSHKETKKDVSAGVEHKDVENDVDQDQAPHGNSQNGSQTEISSNDLHLKTRRFLDRYSISLDRLNELFYKEDGEIKPLVEDYGSTKMAECQIRIALFQALKNGLPNGEFTTTVEAVKAECVDRKTFDGPNWAKTFKRYASFFDFDEFSREVTALRLSEEGKQELASTIQHLS